MNVPGTAGYKQQLQRCKRKPTNGRRVKADGGIVSEYKESRREKKEVGTEKKKINEELSEQYIKKCTTEKKSLCFPRLTMSDSALQTSFTQTRHEVYFVLYVHSITGVIHSP